MNYFTILRKKEQECRSAGFDVTIDFLIRLEGKYYLQKRAANRRLFPNTWEITGGHIEPGEDIVGGLVRELKEETGLELIEIIDILHEFQWDGVLKKGITILIEAQGKLVLEESKISENRLLTLSELRDFIQREELDEPIRIPLERVIQKSTSENKI